MRALDMSNPIDRIDSALELSNDYRDYDFANELNYNKRCSNTSYITTIT